MSLTWWMYRVLARLVLPDQDLSVVYTYTADMSAADNRLMLCRLLMKDHPRHWGRFATYVRWLNLHYPPEQTYLFYLEMQQNVPELIPSLPYFALRCLLSKLCKLTTTPRSSSV